MSAIQHLLDRYPGVEDGKSLLLRLKMLFDSGDEVMLIAKLAVPEKCCDLFPSGRSVQELIKVDGFGTLDSSSLCHRFHAAADSDSGNSRA